MKTIWLLLILSFSLSLSAQEFITIPDKDVPALKQYKINWHTGIDPVQIKDGSWVLNIEVIDLIPSNIRIEEDLKVVAYDLREYLISKPKTILLKTDFKEAELEIVKEPIVKEIIR